MTKLVQKEAKRIADAIVELVERTDRPVTLARIEREIPGFKSDGDLGWQYYIETKDGDGAVWSDMTESGYMALRKILSERRVAVQFVCPQVYLREGRRLRIGESLPIGLVCAAAANFDGPYWLMQVSQDWSDRLLLMPERFRPLNPSPA